jgi:hypothetical protein
MVFFSSYPVAFQLKKRSQVKKQDFLTIGGTGGHFTPQNLNFSPRAGAIPKYFLNVPHNSVVIWLKFHECGNCIFREKKYFVFKTRVAPTLIPPPQRYGQFRADLIVVLLYYRMRASR